MTHPRFSEDEVAEILSLATNPSTREVGSAGGEVGGLTLAELQAIGGEVGIAPERLAAAAREVRARRMTSPPERLLGMPHAVGRVVPLAGPVDDAAWAVLLADLRQTFGANGKVRVEGSTRHWWNGNLQAHVEPSAPGDDGAWRLRLRTRKGSAPGSLAMGAGLGGLGVFLVLMGLLTGADLKTLLVGVGFALAGVGQLGWVRWSLPRWAGERARQMEGLAERWMGAGSEGETPRLPEGDPPGTR